VQSAGEKLGIEWVQACTR